AARPAMALGRRKRQEPRACLARLPDRGARHDEDDRRGHRARHHAHGSGVRDRQAGIRARALLLAVQRERRAGVARSALARRRRSTKRVSPASSSTVTVAAMMMIRLCVAFDPLPDTCAGTVTLTPSAAASRCTAVSAVVRSPLVPDGFGIFRSTAYAGAEECFCQLKPRPAGITTSSRCL